MVGVMVEDRGSSRLPSQYITSPETMKYVQEAGQRSQKIEKIKQEKQAVCKRALLQKVKRDRLVRKLKLQGKL